MRIWPSLSGDKPKSRRRGRDAEAEGVRLLTFARATWRWLSPPEKAWTAFNSREQITHEGRLDAMTGANPSGDVPPIKRRLAAAYAHWFDRLRTAHAAEMANALALIAVRMPAPYDGVARMADVRSNMSALRSAHRQTLEIAFAEECEAEDEIVRFRREHDLERSPLLPDRPWRLVIVLMTLIAVEGLFSSPVFIAASGGGHKLDNILASVFVSAATVGLGVVTGYIGLRYAGFRIREQPWATRAWFVFGSTVATCSTVLAGLLAWNLAISRLGMLGAAQAMAHAPSVREGVVAGMLALMSPMTSVLAFGAVTLFAFSFAVVKSYTGFADPFPFYTGIAKARDDARSAFHAAKTAFYDAMLTMLGEKLRAVQGDLEAEAVAVDEIIQIVGEADAWDHAVRLAPEAAWKRVEADAADYDGAFSAIAAGRPNGTADPDRSDLTDLMACPDFASRLSQAQRQHEHNREAHRDLLKELEEVIGEFTLKSDDEIEDWRATYRNRFRPFGSAVLGEIVPFPSGKRA